MKRTIHHRLWNDYPTKEVELWSTLISSYMELTCYQLRTYLRHEECLVGGLKLDLVKRLVKYDIYTYIDPGRHKATTKVLRKAS